jgi:tRNA pseudouridine13 synthase
VKGEKENIEKAVESLKDVGFINYYGLQRFGNCQKIPTYIIGQALLSSDFKKACELIMQERDGEPNFMKEMRKVYAETKDAKQALRLIHSTNTSVEARLLHGLSQNGDTNYLQGLLKIPRNMLMLYTHAYQSFIFNQIASKRRELGLEVIEGDLVYTEKPDTEVGDTFDETAVEEEAEASEPTEEVEKESKYLTMVRPLTKEDVGSKKFTIYDIVLPLPGHDIR